MSINFNVCADNSKNVSSLQNVNRNSNRKVVSQIAFQGFNTQKLAKEGSNKFSNFAINLKLFFIKTFCNPNQFAVNKGLMTIEQLMYMTKFEINPKKINQIYTMLDKYSTNSEYTQFVKDGINFLLKQKKAQNENFYSSSLFNRKKIEKNSVADNGGTSLIYTIQWAFEKAVHPMARINDDILKRNIAKSKEYMTEFERTEGKDYPQHKRFFTEEPIFNILQPQRSL